jgi:hypothetical protein
MLSYPLQIGADIQRWSNGAGDDLVDEGAALDGSGANTPVPSRAREIGGTPSRGHRKVVGLKPASHLASSEVPRAIEALLVRSKGPDQPPA